MAQILAAAWRSWRSTKGVALLVVLAFSIGIGSATAIYSVIQGVLLKPVPFEHGDRFVSVLAASFDEPGDMSALTRKDSLEFQRQTRSFDLFGCFEFENFNLSAPGQPMHLDAIKVVPGLVNGLGVAPRLGRWFRDDAPSQAVLSDALWRRLGADPEMPGKSVTLNGTIYSVTGVLAPGFNPPLPGPYAETQPDIWVPLDTEGQGERPDLGNTFCYARLRSGATLAQASAEVKAVAARIAASAPASHPAYTARVNDIHELTTKALRPILLLLLAAAELLLLIACANAGGLLVTRSLSRARETAVRIALGETLRSLAARCFLEGLLVALAGAAGGLLLSFAAVRVLAAFAAGQTTRVADVSIDWRVIVFAVLSAVLAGGLASMGPLWHSVHMMPNQVLSEGVRASAGARSRRLSRILVVCEIALAFVLLSVGAVLAGELFRLARIGPGFDPDHLLTFELNVSPDAPTDKAALLRYQQGLVAAIQSIPGVNGASFANSLPLTGCCFDTTIYPVGATANPSSPDRVALMSVWPGYFETMRIPLRRGRFLDDRDREQPLFAVVNETAAKRYWSGRDPVGLMGHFGSADGTQFQVAGVVGDVKNNGLDNPTVPEIYISYTVLNVNPMKFAVRSPVAAASLVPEVLRAVRSVNPAQPVQEILTMNRIVSDSTALKRAASYVMAFFAISALLMAMIGSYGVVSYSVRQRRVEWEPAWPSARHLRTCCALLSAPASRWRAGEPA